MTEMKKYIYDESNGLWYELIGDYYILFLTLPSDEQRPIGRWGGCTGTTSKSIFRSATMTWFWVVALDISSWSERASTEPPWSHYRPDESIWGRNRGAESNRPDGMGWNYEQHPQPSSGNHPLGIDLREGCGMRILEEFWYGNIKPSKYGTSSNKEYTKLMELIFRNEERLKATMTDE